MRSGERTFEGPRVLLDLGFAALAVHVDLEDHFDNAAVLLSFALVVVVVIVVLQWLDVVLNLALDCCVFVLVLLL